MFDQMRKNTKTILWITVAAFVGLIFLAWGADFQIGGKNKLQPGVIGTINGRPIESAAYEQVVTQTRANFQQQYGTEVDDRAESMIREQAWNQFIQQTLMRDEAARRGIRVTDDEVIQAVLSQPPPEVMQNEGFQTNGKFDLAKYQAALRNPNVDTRPLEMEYRQSLPLQKLQMQVVGTVAVSEPELWEAFQSQNEKIKVSFAAIPADKFTVDAAAIPQADLEAYYQAHQRTYKLPEQAAIEFVEIPRKYTETDSLNLVQLAHQVLQECHSGEDFTSLVEAYSEAPASLRGGAQGTYFTEAQLGDPVLKAAAFSLKPGELSDLLMSRGGIHIIKVEDHKTDPAGDQVKIADIFLALKPSPETVGQLRDEAAQFRQEVEKRSFAEVAGEMKLSLRQTPPFSESGFVPELGVAQDVQEYAFTHPAGSISPVMERTNGWLVLRVKQRLAARTPDLTEIQDRVRAEVADSLRMNQAESAAQGLLRQAQSGTPIASVGAGDARVVHETTDLFPRLGSPKGIGSDPRVIGPLFAAQTGLVPKVLRGRTEAVVAVVEQHVPADRTQFEAQKQQQMMSILQRRQSQLFQDWMTSLRKNAKIEDYRFGKYTG